jgi:hypothetical protein
VDEGRYSYDAVEFELIGVGARNLLGNALRVLAAALARIAARWGVLERSAVLTLLEVVGAESLDLMPYLARVEYSEWTRCGRLWGRSVEGS